MSLGARRARILDSRFEAEALEPRRREHGRVAGARIELGEASVDIAAQHDDLEVWPAVADLALPSQARGPDPCPLGQCSQRFMTRRDEGISRIAALERGGDGEAGGQRGGHVLHRMHRDVGAPVQEGVLELLDEESLAAGCREAAVLDPVPFRHDRDQADDEAGMAGGEASGDVLRLPQREPAPACRDSDFPGHAAILPCRVKALGFVPWTGSFRLLRSSCASPGRPSPTTWPRPRSGATSSGQAATWNSTIA